MRIFKSIFLFGAFAFLLTSCLGDDRGGEQTIYGNLPVTAVLVPAEINPAGSITEMDVTYLTTNACQSFVRFDVREDTPSREGRVYNIAVSAAQQGTDCPIEEEEKTEVLKFNPSFAGEYMLNFWTGNNEDGTPKFEKVVQITVPEE